MDTTRRKFLKAVVLGGAFLLFVKSFSPLSFISRRFSVKDKDVFAGLDRRESNKEIIFSDKKGNRVLVVEK